MLFDNLDKNWQSCLKDEFQKEYMKNIEIFLENERKKYTIYPKENEIFTAFKLTSFNHIKVVIVGQDPYHGKNQAHGLAFSVKNNILTPSLRNIFKEYTNDLKLPTPKTTNLSKWANEGVFLINATLTVRAGMANSHQDIGWEHFTDYVISQISQQKKDIIFILWGANAQKKIKFIDSTKHLILKSSHPSPLSAYKSFFNSRVFSKTNNYLTCKGITPINWDLT